MNFWIVGNQSTADAIIAAIQSGRCTTEAQVEAIAKKHKDTVRWADGVKPQGNRPFQKINEACKTTGLSMYYLRNGCKDGSIPHITSGGVYYVNVPALLRKLGAVV